MTSTIILIVAVLIAFSFLILILIYRMYKNSGESDNRTVSRISHKDEQLSGIQRPKKTKTDNEEKIKINPYQREESSLTKAVKELKENYENTDNIELLDIYWKKNNLVAIFSIGIDTSKIIKKRVEHEFIPREEIFKFEDKSTQLDLNDLDFQTQDKARVLIDEFANIYLRKGDIVKKMDNSDQKIDELIERGKNWICSTQESLDDPSNLALEELILEDYFIKFEDLEGREHHINLHKRTGVKKYRIKDQDTTNEDDEFWTQKYTELPFSHGIEVELQVIDRDGTWIDGKQMSAVFLSFLQKACEQTSRLWNNAPEPVKRKWNGKVRRKPDSRGHEALHLPYLHDGKRELYSIIGKDSHVALKTNILEIQTPPCEYLEELEWWAHNLYRMMIEVKDEIEADIRVISGGSNPVEEYSKGVSFGEHHHIGIEDEMLKKEVYNLYRCLLPNLISLTVNSPFSGSTQPNISRNIKENLVITNNSYSTRLKNNKEQFLVPPYLPSEKEKKYFEDKLGRKYDSVRMVDLFPFTRFDTIEVRIFDSQYTTQDRLSICILLQALAQYAKKEMYDSNSLNVSRDTLNKNRSEAIENGPLGRYYSPKKIVKPLKDLNEEDPSYIYQSNSALLKNLYPFMVEIAGEENLAILNLMLRVHNREEILVNPPISPAQSLFLDFEETTEKSLVGLLNEISEKAAKNPKYTLWSEFLDIQKINLDF